MALRKSVSTTAAAEAAAGAPLAGMVFSAVQLTRTHAEVAAAVEGHGGSFLRWSAAAARCATHVLWGSRARPRLAVGQAVAVVREEFLDECLRAGAVVDAGPYLATAAPASAEGSGGLERKRPRPDSSLAPAPAPYETPAERRRATKRLRLESSLAAAPAPQPTPTPSGATMAEAIPVGLLVETGTGAMFVIEGVQYASEWDKPIGLMSKALVFAFTDGIIAAHMEHCPFPMSDISWVRGLYNLCLFFQRTKQGAAVELIYHDLHPRQVLVTKEQDLLFIDFGLSTVTPTRCDALCPDCGASGPALVRCGRCTTCRECGWSTCAL
eukprot:m51a1_g8811 hypothetical protein (325) ;mRNA; f:288152-295245